MIASIVFYLFSSLTIASAVMVIAARNPVHSVLFLILSFFNAAGLFVLLGAEFIAMMLVIVYVGAVAVLFLFVVMMLDINFVKMREGFQRYLPVGGLIGIILLVEVIFVAFSWSVLTPETREALPAPETVTNTEAIGAVLYTKYIFLFQTAGLILLVAMIGAIVLTMRTRPDVRRQSIQKQLQRKVEDTLEIVKDVPKGGGV